MIDWGGLVLTIISAGVPGIRQLAGMECILTIFATLLYLAGVQLPTIAVNVPLNNRLQSFNVGELNDQTITKERQYFEPRWNTIRTVVACITSLALIVLLIWF